METNLPSQLLPPGQSTTTTTVNNLSNPTSTPEVPCRLPFSDTTPIDFVVPRSTRLRVRRAAHLVDDDYVRKFETAIKLLKDLPADDPRRFYVYGADAYNHVGVADGQLNSQVPNDWLFFPWHRVYLYFYERVIGKLLGDENFAIPFWNWDHPEGMQIPPLYTNTNSPIHGTNRRPTMVIDHSGADPEDLDRDRQIENNLAVVHRTMVTNGKTAELFMGGKPVTGSNPNPGAGIQLVWGLQSHIDNWSGNSANAISEDMGNFYSSGRDIMFYGLHANVDRMWDIWTKTLGHQNFSDDEYLHAAFYFYDENKRLVRVRVSDALDSEKLGYTYETRELPWRYNTRKPYSPPAGKTFKTTAEPKELAAKTAGEFPLALTSTVSVAVKRPKKARSDEERATEEEVLVIRDIEPGQSIFAKFDVFVNAPDTAGLTPSAAEFAGSFSNVPHKKHGAGKGVEPPVTSLRLGLSELLKEIGAEGDEDIVVTLVPRKRDGKIKIGGVGIQYIQIR